MRIVWTRPAADDLDSLEAFIAEDGPVAAVETVVRILSLVSDLLSDFPHSGRSGRVPGTRELIMPDTPFIVAYRVEAGVLQVLRVLRAARRWPDRL